MPLRTLAEGDADFVDHHMALVGAHSVARLRRRHGLSDLDDIFQHVLPRYVAMCCARAFSVPIKSERGSVFFCFDAFSSREPVSTSLENALDAASQPRRVRKCAGRSAPERRPRQTAPESPRA